MMGCFAAGHRYFAESVRTLARKHINPMKVMIDGAHSMGIKVHVGIRPGGWSFVVAAYTLTAAVFIIYAVSLIARLRGEQRRSE